MSASGLSASAASSWRVRAISGSGQGRIVTDGKAPVGGFHGRQAAQNCGAFGFDERTTLEPQLQSFAVDPFHGQRAEFALGGHQSRDRAAQAVQLGERDGFGVQRLRAGSTFAGIRKQLQGQALAGGAFDPVDALSPRYCIYNLQIEFR